MGRYQTFIIRFWAEEAERPARGHIQSVTGRRGVYFRDADRLLEFIREQLEPASLPDGRAASPEDSAEGSESRASGGDCGAGI